MTEHFQDTGFVPLNIAVLTISDRRRLADDRSGDTLQGLAEAAGHRVLAREIVRDDVYQCAQSSLAGSPIPRFRCSPPAARA